MSMTETSRNLEKVLVSDPRGSCGTEETHVNVTATNFVTSSTNSKLCVLEHAPPSYIFMSIYVHLD